MKKIIKQEYKDCPTAIVSKCLALQFLDEDNKIEYCEAKEVLWDTGATNTIISNSIAKALHLIPIKKDMISGIGGMIEVNSYKISLYFEQADALIKDLEVYAHDLSDYDIVIGMDTITKGDFVINNKDGETLFSYSFP